MKKLRVYSEPGRALILTIKSKFECYTDIALPRSLEREKNERIEYRKWVENLRDGSAEDLPLNAVVG